MNKNGSPARPDDTQKIETAHDTNEALDLLRQHGPAVAIGLAVAVAIFIAIILHRHRQETARQEASELFASAQGPQQLEAVIDQYPNSPEAPMALLTLASERYGAGEFELTEMHYHQFLDQFTDHTMRPAAELGLTHCHEALGRTEDALNGFRSFVAAQGDHYLAPLARLGEARVLAQQGNFEAARAIYEEIIDDPDSPWQAQAQSSLRHMEKDARAQDR